MPRLLTFSLCSYAEVREGLLTMVSGGAGGFYASSLGANLPASAAIIIELAPDETNVAHELEFDVIHLETAAKVVRVNAGFRAYPNARALAGDFFQIPFAVDLRSVQISHWGTHDAVVRINSTEVSRLTFRVHSMSS